MIIKIAKVTEFIPKWNDNLNLKPGEQIKIKHASPSIALKDSIYPKPKAEYTFDEKGNPTGGTTTMEIDRKALIKGMNISIENLSYEVGDNKIVNVVSAKDLFSDTTPTEFDDLINEISGYFQEILASKVDEKK